MLGLGYIGLPTASVLAQHGHDVIGVDVRPDVVDTNNRGEIHIHEPALDELVQQVVARGKLRADLAPQSADVFFICVPTPMTEDHKPDLTFVEAAAKSIRSVVKPGSLIILESTSPPGTTENVVLKHAVSESLVVGQDVFVCSLPRAGSPRPDSAGGDRKRPRCGRNHAGLHTTRDRVLPRLRVRQRVVDECRHGRTDEADRKLLPRCQHRVCERIVDAGG